MSRRRAISGGRPPAAYEPRPGDVAGRQSEPSPWSTPLPGRGELDVDGLPLSHVLAAAAVVTRGRDLLRADLASRVPPESKRRAARRRRRERERAARLAALDQSD